MVLGSRVKGGFRVFRLRVGLGRFQGEEFRVYRA